MDSRKPDLRKEMRRNLRAKRRALTPTQQRFAAQQLVKHLRSHPLFLRSQHVAFHMAADGELGLGPLLQAAQSMGKCCYLPVLHPLKQNALWFCHYRDGDVLVNNRFGLAEPLPTARRIPPRMLDLVLMPLVGFDRSGNRLGMGGGFYDRTFAFKQDATRRTRLPVLMGIAHSCQEVESLSGASWDVPMDFVATECEVLEL